MDARKLSARTLLFDPPRYFKPSAEDVIEPIDQSFVTQDFGVKQPRTNSQFSSRPASSATSRPARQVTADPIKFGQVEVGQKKICVLPLLNSGRNPIHFSVSRLSNPALRVLSLPGVVYPGLKTLFRVEILAKQPGEITDAFRVTSAELQLTVPVTATVTDACQEKELVAQSISGPNTES
jgi:hypothetical protein